MSGSSANASGLALVMSGGGARAAYQIGCLRALARHFPDLHLPIVTGVSAGAINAAYLATHVGPFGQKAHELVDLWSSLRAERVFRVGLGGLALNVARTGLGLVSGGLVRAPRNQSMVDTSPLRRLLTRRFGARADGSLGGVAENLASGALDAVAITTSSYTTGQSITWVQGRDVVSWNRAHRRSRVCTLTVEHVMASSALPLLFPASRLEGGWYGDGGMRLSAPLSPAVHLGARRILAISTRYEPSEHEASEPMSDGYPPTAQIAGALFNAVFLDQFDADALELQRVNRLVAAVDSKTRGDLRPLELFLIRPSLDLGRLANEYEARLPGAFRFMTRGLGTRETRSNDLLSLVMFQPDYLTALLDIGDRDATARMPAIEAFLCDPS